MLHIAYCHPVEFTPALCHKVAYHLAALYLMAKLISQHAKLWQKLCFSSYFHDHRIQKEIISLCTMLNYWLGAL